MKRNLQQIEQIKEKEVKPLAKKLKQSELSNVYENLTPHGLKNTLHGNRYQLALLTLAAIRGSRDKKKKIRLITEALEFLTFDDLVLVSDEDITLLQVKHTSKNENYSAIDFCANCDGDASLAKYFDSWYQLKNSKF